MSLPLTRLLALAIAASLGLSQANPVEAATSKARAHAPQHSRTSTHRSTRPASRPASRSKARRPAPVRRSTRSSHPAAASHSTPPPAAPQTKAMQLEALYDQYWNESLKLNPLQATLQGDPRYNSELPNFLSAASRQQTHEFNQQWLQKIEAIGPDGLSGQELLSYQIFVRDARNLLDAERFPSWMLPINQYFNIANVTALLGSGTGAQPFETVQDYDNWSHRSLGIPDLFDQAIANMTAGMQAGVVQPKALMEKVLPQLDAVIKPSAEESIFWAPVRNMPESFSAEDKARISAEYKRMIEYRIMPAYRALRGFIATRYLPACRDSAGRSALPDGAAWYAYDIRQSTTSSDLTAAAIHQIGVDEVARIQQQILDQAKLVKLRGNLQKIYIKLQEDHRFSYRTPEALLDEYRKLQTRVQTLTPRMFSQLPQAPLEIKPVEDYRAATAATASYVPPTALDGSRPGTLYINTSNLDQRDSWEVQSLFLHEAIPGHHYQMGLQQELKDLPRFRRLGGETAFIEGWGLYAESLGSELGLYDDPYSQLGWLRNELWRAVRLVVDTGVNADGWSRQQAIKYNLDNAPASREEAEAEVERVMAIPGQALANKIGELKIRALREQASRELGPAFNLSAFHAQVLKDGSIPLDLLQADIEQWIASQKAGK